MWRRSRLSARTAPSPPRPRVARGRAGSAGDPASRAARSDDRRQLAARGGVRGPQRASPCATSTRRPGRAATGRTSTTCGRRTIAWSSSVPRMQPRRRPRDASATSRPDGGPARAALCSVTSGAWSKRKSPWPKGPPGRHTIHCRTKGYGESRQYRDTYRDRIAPRIATSLMLRCTPTHAVLASTPDTALELAMLPRTRRPRSPHPSHPRDTLGNTMCLSIVHPTPPARYVQPSARNTRSSSRTLA